MNGVQPTHNSAVTLPFPVPDCPDLEGWRREIRVFCAALRDELDSIARSAVAERNPVDAPTARSPGEQGSVRVSADSRLTDERLASLMRQLNEQLQTCSEVPPMERP